MKRYWLLFFVACVCVSGMLAQKKFSMYAVGFYNLENLFDTVHDEGKNDYEYLPDGGYRWNGLKYFAKLKNMSKVLSEIGTDRLPNVGAAVIGVSEVENARVLQALVDQPDLKKKGMKFVHIEGPDTRGVDCALLYNPRLFFPEKSFLKPYVFEPEDTTYKTRGFLTVQGKMAGDPVTFIVCHWPSRFAGSYHRELAGRQVKVLKDSILNADPEMKVIVMGDMNDDPFDKSMAQELSAKRYLDEVGDGDMYNPWWEMLVGKGQGTLLYDGKWNLFDQIVLSPNLINKDKKRDFSTLKFFKNEVFLRDYLFQTEGKYKGNMKRTTAGGVWLNGYSDHLPVVVYLLKEKK